MPECGRRGTSTVSEPSQAFTPSAEGAVVARRDPASRRELLAEDCSAAVAGPFRDLLPERCGNELLLPAVPVRRGDQDARDRVSQRRSVVPAGQVHAHVYSGRRTGAGDDVPPIEVEGLRPDTHPRVAGGVLPVRGDLQAVQQSGRRELEDAQAVRGQRSGHRW
jgi:hypothetical protein